MPSEKGRSGKAGNSTAYKSIGIKSANPSKMSANRSRSNMSVGEVFSRKAGKKK